MTQDRIDRMLSGDDEIVPASGFVASVMDAVRREAATPPPIPFPWVRLAVGSVAVVPLAAWLASSATTAPIWNWLASLSADEGQAILARAVDQASRTGATWTVGALLLALVSSRLSVRLATPRD